MTEMKVYQSPEWRKFRINILNSKGKKCEKCGVETISPVVHHKNYEDGSIFDRDMANYEILCKSCHYAHHMRKGMHDFKRAYLLK
jgi:5-methylcytosine-specific restriction endonuclease McrA